MEAVQSQFIMTMLSSLTFTWRVCTPKPVLNKCLLCAKQSSTHLMILTHRCMLSHFSHAQLFATPRTVACQAFLSIGLSRQEYWSRLLCPPPGDLPDPGIEPEPLTSTCTGRQVLYHSHFKEPLVLYHWEVIITQKNFLKKAPPPLR